MRLRRVEAAGRQPRKRAGYSVRRHRAMRVGLVAEYVIREGLEWGWVVLVRSAAGHDRLKLGESLLEIVVCDRRGKKA